MSHACVGLAVEDEPLAKRDSRGLQLDRPGLVLPCRFGGADHGIHGVGEVLEDELLVVHAHRQQAVQEDRDLLLHPRVHHIAAGRPLPV